MEVIIIGKEYDEFMKKEIEKYEEKKVLEQGVVLLHAERPLKTLSDIVIHFCETVECKNCPVHIHNYDKRTEHQKENQHMLCASNLYKWIIEEASKVNLGDLE